LYGARQGLCTKRLSAVHRGENPITAVTFNPELAHAISKRCLPNTQILIPADLDRDISAESFDHIVADSMLCGGNEGEICSALYR
jgi:hypothetical protein